jgi:bifunctional DNA-binding transcriptional regulator/antitoxin component of YhaV-PrlF toxin-antitoxin module
MGTIIDASGRLVIPKSLRRAIGLSAGEVEIAIVGGELRIAPIASDKLVEDGGLLMLPDGEALTDDELRELRLVDQW